MLRIFSQISTSRILSARAKISSAGTKNVSHLQKGPNQHQCLPVHHTNVNQPTHRRSPRPMVSAFRMAVASTVEWPAWSDRRAVRRQSLGVNALWRGGVRDFFVELFVELSSGFVKKKDEGQ